MRQKRRPRMVDAQIWLFDLDDSTVHQFHLKWTKRLLMFELDDLLFEFFDAHGNGPVSIRSADDKHRISLAMPRGDRFARLTH